MAQWAKIAQIIHTLPSDTVHSLYPPLTFPIEARFYAAEWIENQRWEDYALERVDLENNARELLDKTWREFQNVALQLNVVERIKLMQVARNMGNYSSNALQFAVLVRDTLRKERELINSADPKKFNIQQNYKTEDIASLERKVCELIHLRYTAQQHQEEINWERQNLETIEKLILKCRDPEDIKKATLYKQKIMKLEYEIDQLITRRARLLDACVPDLQKCQRDYLGKLQEWKYAQHKAVIGFPFDSNLLPLQMWSEQLLSINEKLRQELMLLGTPMLVLKITLEKLLNALLDSSLVVEKQPPQVIKTQSKFSTTVRCLLGEKVMTGKPVVIKAQIVNEYQAKNLGNLPSDTVAELINNQSILEKHPGNNTTCATFRNMSVRKIKRADRKGSESVTEEKFAILFSAEILYSGCESPYNIQMISLPVVITVHGSQDSNALATILWDCAFARPDRVPFAVPDSVSWREMCQTLNCKFTSEVNTQHNLDSFNLHFLAQKIFDKPESREDLSEMMVSWAQFNKEVLPGRSFTFWQWFEGVTELSKKQLRPYWSEGLIFGFIGKHHIHMILHSRPNGTFLLRFSDSEIGGITIAYVSANETGGQKVQNIQPFSKRDLEIRSLADRIRDINEIMYLYPSVPKDEAFGKFYTGPLVPPSDGYLPATLHTKVGSEVSTAPPHFPVNSVTPIIPDPESILDLPDLEPLYQDFEEFVLDVPPNGATMDMLEN